MNAADFSIFDVRVEELRGLRANGVGRKRGGRKRRWQRGSRGGGSSVPNAIPRHHVIAKNLLTY